MNRYIQKLILEQFNIGGMDLNNSDKPKRNWNIFNKNIANPYYEKVLDKTITEDEIQILNSLVGVTKPKDKNELDIIIKFYAIYFPTHSLNWLDVSGITDMNKLFMSSDYNGDISKWDTSNVTNMWCMFCSAHKFNQPIGGWDVSSVTDMHDMFNYAKNFNQPIGDWDVSSVKDMHWMFHSAYNFNQPIGDWDVSSVTDMSTMFSSAKNFNQPIGDWDVSSVTDMSTMFSSTDYFNQPIGDWDVSSVTNMDGMFASTKKFNQPISNWDVSNVTNMESMFYNSNFQCDISKWNVKRVKKHLHIFERCTIKDEYMPKKFRSKKK